MTLDSIRPINGFVLLRKVDATQQTPSGLHLPVSADRNNTGEGAGVVVAMASSPEIVVGKDGGETLLYPEKFLAVGEKVIHRGFLRHVNAVGNLVGCPHHDDLYLIKISDLLAVIEGDGVTVGKYGEYRA